MSEHNQEIPFLWRLSSQDEQGFCAVSMVVPLNQAGDEGLGEEHTIQTRIMSFADDLAEADEDEVLEWNEEDINLFLKLIASRVSDKAGKPGESVKVDLSDPRIIEVIQIVAAAGFGAVVPGDEFVQTSQSDLPSADVEIGSQVSINTTGGYKSCIVVDANDDDVICVILDRVKAAMPGFVEDVEPYDLLLLKRHHLLSSQYSSQSPSRADILH